MLDAINKKRRSIKHVQNKFFGGVDVIVIGYFYQAPPIKGQMGFPKN
jgi:hypothetical protein